jgi:SAM-dependent methyltransferase
MSVRHQYYNEAREEIDVLLPAVNGIWLEIGAGNLVLANRVLKTRSIVRYDFIEPVATPVIDDPRLTKVAETVESWHAPNCQYDVVVALDVIEHVVDTESLLSKIVDSLKPEGYLVTSIPNVAHYSIIRRLLGGKFEYSDSGILDRTHVRFFTPASVDGLFQAAGFKKCVSLYKTRTGAMCNFLRRFRCYQYLSLWRLAERRADESSAVTGSST